MPRYFFDLPGSSAPKDILGVELANDAAAHRHRRVLDGASDVVFGAG